MDSFQNSLASANLLIIFSFYFQTHPAMIKLESWDGKIFEVEVKVARLSLLLKEMLEDLGVEENEVILITQNGPKISGAGAMLGKMIQWVNHQKV